MIKYLSPLFCLLYSCTLLHAEDKYVLTDTNGVPIECTLIDYEKGHVLIDMGGDRYSLPLSRFSKASGRDVIDWAADRSIRNGNVRIGISSRRRESSRDSENRQIQTVHYDLTITNDGKVDIDGLEVEYKIYWLDGRVEVSDPFYFWIDRNEPIGRLNIRGKHAIKTSSITLKERENRKDNIIGIWVRLYRNGQSLHESSSPVGLLKQVEWRNMSLEAIY